MHEYKNFVIYIIVLSFAVQLGKLILSNTKFNNIYKTSASILIIIAIVFYLKSLSYEVTINEFDNNDISYYSNENIKYEFENKLEKIIKGDIHNKYYVNLNISVSTDFDKLVIRILQNDISNINDIRNYIFDKYCTPGDEVIISDEHN